MKHNWILLIVILYSLLMAACFRQETNPSEDGKIIHSPSPELFSKPTKTESSPVILITQIQKTSTPTDQYLLERNAEITLYTNLDIDMEYDLNMESLVNKDNTRAFFDFDNNEITNSEKADIYLSVSCGSDCFLQVLNIYAAKARRIGGKEPGLMGCLNALENKSQNFIFPDPGYYSCLHTNAGNIVQFLPIDEKSFSINGYLTFQYLLWKKIQ
ncbi:MAG: hypothetical protein AB9891_03795 [Anaerolineaceae bacterium]